MIDLTPLDVQKKKGDFRRAMRGYDPAAVDEFLDLVAERMAELVRENGTLAVSMDNLSQGLQGFRERERALNDALVSAQQLREETRVQAQREADLIIREAQAEAERIVGEAKRQVGASAESLRRIHAQRARYLTLFRQLAEKQLADIQIEEDRLGTLRGDGDATRERAVPFSGSGQGG